MLIAVGVIGILLFSFLPQWWVRREFRRYGGRVDALPMTGGDLARHLVKKLELAGATVKITAPESDHYDPESRTIALSPEVHDGKSLTAVAIAAHEVGHALQHNLGYRPLYLRWRMAGMVAAAEKTAALLLLSLPLVVIITRVPALGGLLLIAGLVMLSLPVMFHLITLPVELDASFNRALPILRRGGYLPEAAVPAADRVLLAAAFTYVAASLASLLNFYRWISILRRR
jgi:Zn-dependent membrane protease YugP